MQNAMESKMAISEINVYLFELYDGPETNSLKEADWLCL